MSKRANEHTALMSWQFRNTVLFWARVLVKYTFVCHAFNVSRRWSQFSIYLSIYLSIYIQILVYSLSIYLSICLSIYRSSYRFFFTGIGEGEKNSEEQHSADRNNNMLGHLSQGFVLDTRYYNTESRLWKMTKLRDLWWYIHNHQVFS